MRVLVVVLAVAATIAGCSRPPVDPLRLEGNLLTVDNRSKQDWSHVEIWLNTYYRATVSSVPAHSRWSAPLDAFVAGYGQRFDFHHAQIRDLRLTAKLPDGSPLEIKKEFTASGLGGVFGGKH